MATAKTVLVPVDGSACSMRALEYAGEQQQACAELSIRVLCVQPPLPSSRFVTRAMIAEHCATQSQRALKPARALTQTQCRATLETLAEIKNPQPVAFVRQANIAHGPQQVNNSSSGDASRAGNSENQPNKVLEHQDGERLDFGTEGAAGGANTPMEAVGAINRSEDRSG